MIIFALSQTSRISYLADNELVAKEIRKRSFQNLLLQYTGDCEGTIIDDVASITDEKVRYDIVHQMIEWASIERVDGYKMRTIIRIYDKESKETKYLLDSRSHKIYSKFTPEGIGTKEVEGAFEERFAPSISLITVLVASLIKLDNSISVNLITFFAIYAISTFQ